MKTLYDNAQNAIADSIRYGRIAYCEDGPDHHEALLAECDDSADNGDVAEYWGTDHVGNTWRVHIVSGS